MSTQPQSDALAARDLYTQGQNRLQYGDLEGARRMLVQAVSLDPAMAEAQYQLGNCYRLLRRADEAEAAFKAALAADPNLTSAWFGLSFLYAETGRTEEAGANLSKLVNHFSGNLDIQHQAGGLLADFGLYKDAAALYERILEREPQARSHLRLGQYYQKMGRYEDAARQLSRAIELNPDASAAYLLLANNKRYTRDAADQSLLKRFTAALERPEASQTTRACLNFALGKMYDDLDDYDRAFPYFERGNQLRREGPRFVPQEWLDTARQIEELEPRHVTAVSTSTSGPAPLFVVGMLRSGTTLVERILASHNEAAGLGEASWLDETVGKAVAETGLPYPACLLRITDATVATLRGEYMRHWPSRGLDQTKYMVDKNPINFMYLGLIARIFPEAKIVHCARDARDASLSIYFQNFANPENGYAYDLADIAHFHNGYARMMRHWERILPPGMLHTIDYEALVQDQERSTRTLLSAVDLPWDPACLDFHKQSDGISTASVWQARQPIYTRSVGRWRHYERHLGPLLNTLATR